MYSSKCISDVVVVASEILVSIVVFMVTVSG